MDLILVVFVPLILGFFVGYLLKRPPKNFFFWISLFLLLFFIGYKTGKSVSNFLELGKILGNSLVLSLASIAGSIAFVIPFWRRIN